MCRPRSAAAMRLSESRGMITEAETERFKEALMRFHIVVRVSALTAGDIIEATKNDKKMESGVINFILLKSVGCAYVDRPSRTVRWRKRLSSS